MKNNIIEFFILLLVSGFGCKSGEKAHDFLQESAILDSKLEGISAPFAGIHGDYLIVAGGCNFPEKPVSEGGKKVYYSGIYIIHKDSLTIRKTWTKIGELPNPLAYGKSVTIPEGVLCIGGQNEEKSTDDVFLLQYNPAERKITRIAYPNLPSPTDNASGAVLDNWVYLSGGNSDGYPSNQFLKLNLQNLEIGWQSTGTLPENSPRVQPVLLPLRDSQNPKLLLTGGFSKTPIKINIHTDCWIYDVIGEKWHECSMSNHERHNKTFTGATGVAFNDSLLMIVGGIDAEIFHHGLKISMELSEAIYKKNEDEVDSLAMLNREYLTKKPKYYQFNRGCWLYNSKQNTWQVLFEDDRIALAGAVAISFNNKVLFINGEIKPGIRTKKNYLLRIDDHIIH